MGVIVINILLGLVIFIVGIVKYNEIKTEREERYKRILKYTKEYKYNQEMYDKSLSKMERLKKEFEKVKYLGKEHPDYIKVEDALWKFEEEVNEYRASRDSARMIVNLNLR